MTSSTASVPSKGNLDMAAMRSGAARSRRRGGEQSTVQLALIEFQRQPAPREERGVFHLVAPARALGQRHYEHGYAQRAQLEQRVAARACEREIGRRRSSRPPTW